MPEAKACEFAFEYERKETTPNFGGLRHCSMDGYVRRSKLFPPSDIDLLQAISDLLLRPTYQLPLFHPAIF